MAFVAHLYENNTSVAQMCFMLIDPNIISSVLTADFWHHR